MNKRERIKELYGNRGAKTAFKQPTKQQGILAPCRDRYAELDGDYIVMTFPKQKALIDIVKRITQRSYVTGNTIQTWEAPASLDCLDKLREGGFTLDPAILQWEKDLFKPVVYDLNFKAPAGMNHPEYPERYQLEAVQFFEQKGGRALLADDPGLGKTLEIIMWLHLRQDIHPVLIICPANAKWTWYNEFLFWLPTPSVQLISGNAETKIWGDFVIINFDILSQLQDVWDEEKGKYVKEDVLRQDIWDIKWDCLICDESQYIVNRESIRGWAVDNLISKVPYLIHATATPGDKNKHKFTLANQIDKRIFPSFYKFAFRYCDPKKAFKGGWDFNGSSNELELNELLCSTIMLRRTKEEVFKNFPKILRQVVSLPINNVEQYEAADVNFEQWVRDSKGKSAVVNTTFQKIEALTQLAVKGKMDAAIEWIWDLLDTSKKIIIFCDHKTVVEILMEEFGDIAVKVDGSTSDKKREEAKQLFQQCKRCKVRKEKHDYDANACEEYVYDMGKRVFVGTKAAKESITLTAAYDEIFLETWWSAGDINQAEGRCYGRKGDLHGATAWFLVAHGTIEEHKIKILDIKNMRNEKVMNGKELSREQILTELLREYRNAKSK